MEEIARREVNANSYSDCLERALKIQEGAAQSVARMRQRLGRIGFSEEVANKVVSDLLEMHVLSDEALAASRFLRRREKGYGTQYARSELFSKGLTKETIDEVLQSADEEGEALGALYALRKVDRKEGEEGRHYQDRRRATLARRGFSYATIRKAEDLDLEDQI